MNSPAVADTSTQQTDLGIVPIRRALISVSDKASLLGLARMLRDRGVHIISTGGTAKHLAMNEIPVEQVYQYTGVREMLDGRVKTLHPKIHAGLLARRGVAKDEAEMVRAHYGYIDLVVVNLYPFAQTVAKPGCTLEEAIENIDIGGPTKEQQGRYGPHRARRVRALHEVSGALWWDDLGISSSPDVEGVLPDSPLRRRHRRPFRRTLRKVHVPEI